MNKQASNAILKENAWNDGKYFYRIPTQTMTPSLNLNLCLYWFNLFLFRNVNNKYFIAVFQMDFFK